MPYIPKSMNEVTPDWVVSCLGRGRLNNLALEPMGEGVGMMSAMARLRLDWADDAGLPASLVLKLAADNETNRSVAKQFNLYLKEVNYYRELAPQTGARSPKIHASDIDAAQNFFLLMEDASDYRMGSQVTGATPEECRLCVDFLVQLHAAFWNRLEDVAWLPHMSNSDNARNMALGCELGWAQMMTYFSARAPAAINARKEDYLAGIPWLQERLDRAPRTLIQGDFRMDNMLFGRKAGHAPLLVVDFQGPLKGNGIQDLAYLLSHSAQTRVRRAHEQALLRRYVDGMAAAGIKGYSFDEAWADYRIAVLYCWTVAVVIAGTLDPANDRGFAWMSKMVERNGIAIDDLACLDLL